MDLATRLAEAAALLQEHVALARPNLSSAAWDADLPLLDTKVAGLTTNFVAGRAAPSPVAEQLDRRCANELAGLASQLEQPDELALVRRLQRMTSLVAGSL